MAHRERAWHASLAQVPWAEGTLFCASCGEPMRTRESLVSEGGHLCETCEATARADLDMGGVVRAETRSAWALAGLVFSWGALPWLGLAWTAPVWTFALLAPLMLVLWLMALGRSLECLRAARRASHGGVVASARQHLTLAGWTAMGLALLGMASALIGVVALVG